MDVVIHTGQAYAGLPHGKFTNEKAKRILGWRPTDNLENFWKKREISG